MPGTTILWVILLYVAIAVLLLSMNLTSRWRWWVKAAAIIVTGGMVAVGGAIGFVSLVVPHAVRLAVGSRHRVLLPASMLVGAIFMLWSDTAARSLFDPRELPVGIVTALVGAPAFLLILLRYRRIT